MSQWADDSTNTAEASTSPSISSSSTPLLSTGQPQPLPSYLQQIGLHISELASKQHSGSVSPLNPHALHSANFITPLLAAFTARCITLEAEEQARATQTENPYPILEPEPLNEGLVPTPASSSRPHRLHLTKDAESSLIRSTLHRLHQLDEPLVETLKLQVSFESSYASEVARRRRSNLELDAANEEALNKIVDIGSNLTSNQVVASLYRAIFRLMMKNGCIDPKLQGQDRNIDREIAAALESVFPQSGLNAFTMQSAAEKKVHILNLINIVLGIRLFNRDINKGGAGLVDLPTLATNEVETFYEALEKESTTLGDICATYSEVLQMELERPGTIAASMIRLQHELLNRRQYILLLHQLQHEVLESMDGLKEAQTKFAEVCGELRTLVGLRSAVPKESVYPKFQQLALVWRSMEAERDMNRMRNFIFEQILLQYRQSFTSNLMEEDIELLTKNKKENKNKNEKNVVVENEAEFDEFVETLQASSDDSTLAEESKESSTSSSSPAASYRPVRLIKDNTPNFMSLPLEYQGYCPWTIVHRGGLLLPGNPALGIIRVLGRHYSFVSREAMREFVEDPEKYVEGVLSEARKCPTLIHLLCLQPYIPHSDISELFMLKEMMQENHAASSTYKVSTGCQTPQYINTSIPDPHYHWNEWELRRQALHLADLSKKKTVSSQTNLSHFRRDNATQYTLPRRHADGTAEGKGTQTGIEKSQQVERVYHYHAGLRGRPADPQTGHPGAAMRVVELRIGSQVEDTSNPSIQLKPGESLKTRIVRDIQK